jgi:hypothetical protein
MSESGQSRRFAPPPMTSDLPPEADIVRAGHHVSKVPDSDLAGEIERWEKSGSAPMLARWKRAFGISLAPVT